MKKRMAMPSWHGLGLCALLATLPILSGCTITLTDFHAPATAVRDRNFEIVIEGTTANGGAVTDMAGVVIQLPPGVSFLNALAYPGYSTVDDPAILSLYTPEPGHTLVAISGGMTQVGDGQLRARLRAPAALGPITLKVSLMSTHMGTPYVQSPPGISDFAAITASTAPDHVRTVDVVQVGDPSAPRFVDLSDGLPASFPYLYDVVVADFNGDGYDDVYPHRAGKVFLATPGGGFVDGPPFPPIPFVQSSFAAAGDFDGDGNQDLVANQPRWVYFGDGMGGFLPGNPLDAGSNLGTYDHDWRPVATGDVNNDGFDDVVQIPKSGNIAYMRCFVSDGSGSWTEQSNGLPQLPSTQWGIADLLLEDFDNDGNRDILYGYNGIITIWSSDGQGGWVATSAVIAPNQLFSSAVAHDFDGDGDLDLLAIASNQPYPAVGAFSANIYRNDLTNGGGWALLNSFSLGAISRALAVALDDFDGDGTADLVVASTDQLPSNQSGTARLDVWYGAGGGQFSQPTVAGDGGLPFGLYQWPLRLATGDIDGDGARDLVAMTRYMIQVWTTGLGNPLGACATGTVGGVPGTIDVVAVNGSAAVPGRIVPLGIGQPITISVAQPPSNPMPAQFALWGFSDLPDPTVSYATPFGTMCFAPAPIAPVPGSFTLANTFVPNSPALVPASPAPWSFTSPSGVPIPIVFTIQGVIIDSAQTSNNVAITNAVAVAVY